MYDLHTFCRLYNTTPEIVHSSDLFTFRYLCYRSIPILRNVKLPKPVLNSEKESVLIEFRPMPHIEFLLRNTMYQLGEGWSHTIVCGKGNYQMIQSICDFVSEDIRIIALDYENIDINIYNNLCYDPFFWRSLRGEKILLYQEDSILFNQSINDFLQYDYIGAPWKLNVSSKYRVGNGGLSLRSKSVILSVLDENRILNTFEDIKRRRKFPRYDRIPEDLFFAKEIQDKGGKIPTVSVASLFSTENIVNKHSMGGHQFWLFDPSWRSRMEKLIVNYETMMILNSWLPSSPP